MKFFHRFRTLSCPAVVNVFRPTAVVDVGRVLFAVVGMAVVIVFVIFIVVVVGCTLLALVRTVVVGRALVALRGTAVVLDVG